MPADIEIAQNAELRPIGEIAATLGLSENELELYGKYKAKLSEKIWEDVKTRPDGRLILVTAITPTPAGEGKTTTTVGLGQAMSLLGKKAVIALREPSLGPVMGIKGGAAGGGYSQVVPMEDINLHFTGDIHAVTSANNLLSAAIDNHIHQGNELGINPEKVVWKRCMDMNDRALRQINVGLGGKSNGVPREDGFQITAASEVMAILCLADGMEDLKQRLGRIIAGYSYAGEPVTAAELRVNGAMALLLKEAIKPNLVQTLEHSPALIHGGPFANIAHGCSSVAATRLALKLADCVITEAGFGADLGAEKFFDIKCRAAGLKPDAAVMVATVRALKHHGGAGRDQYCTENLAALDAGFPNLEKHLRNIAKFGLPCIVAINAFPTDTEAELALVRRRCEALGVEVALSYVHEQGGAGGIELAAKLLRLIENSRSEFRPLYSLDLSVKEKISKIACEIYGAEYVSYSGEAEASIIQLERFGLGSLPICIAKTQFSLSDNKNLCGCPRNFTLSVREVQPSAGAGFIVVKTGDIMTMPGLSKCPSFTNMDIDSDGIITGLF